MAATYFSDQQRGPRARDREDIPETVWGGLVALIQTRLTDGSFGDRFPEECPDRRGTIGSNDRTLALVLRAEVLGIEWPLDAETVPDTLAVLDLVQFCYASVASPVQQDYHSFFDHYHVRFEQEEGREQLRRCLLLLPIEVYPTKELWNLAPADRRCDERIKSDRLRLHQKLTAAAPHLVVVYGHTVPFRG